MSAPEKAQDATPVGVVTDTDFFTAKPVPPKGTHSLTSEDGQEIGRMEVLGVGDEGLPDRASILTKGAEQAKATIDAAVARGDDFIVMAQNSAAEGTTVVTGAFHPFTAMAMVDMFLASIGPLLGVVASRDDGGSSGGTPAS